MNSRDDPALSPDVWGRRFEEVVRELEAMPNDCLIEFLKKLPDIGVMWSPDPENIPQLEAYCSQADFLLYGGQAGGGKTDLLLGVAGTDHHRSAIFRRVFPSLRAIIDRSREIYNASEISRLFDRYNESLHRWKLDSVGRQIEFVSLQYEKDVLQQQGQARDFHGFDEITEFSEYQVRYVTGWNRSTRKNQRCRVIGTCNPPTTVEGRWIVNFWGPWLDEHHPNPAKVGELRWFTTQEGRDFEVAGPEDYVLDKRTGMRIMPKSRTFISASVSDNRYLRDSGYIATLQALPEPLRSIMLYGDFKAAMADDPWQIIPTAWVKMAMHRWRNGSRPNIRVEQVGVDVARGGRDRTVLSPRRGRWFERQHVHEGKKTQSGQDVITLIVAQIPEAAGALVTFDAIGVGSSPMDFWEENGLNGYGFVASEKSEATDRSGRLRFANKRAEAYWKLREALDPEKGDELYLPDDPELLADLCTPKFELGASGIRVEPKEDIVERIKRSPDKGDALVYAHYIPHMPHKGVFEYFASLEAERIARIEKEERERAAQLASKQQQSLGAVRYV